MKKIFSAHNVVVVGESSEHSMGHAGQLAGLLPVQAPLRVDVGEAGCPDRSDRCGQRAGFGKKSWTRFGMAVCTFSVPRTSFGALLPLKT